MLAAWMRRLVGRRRGSVQLWRRAVARLDLDPLLATGHRLLVGASRKTFLGTLLADDAGPRPVGEREAAHLAVVLELARAGVWGVRVHDVRSARDALAALAAMRTETPSEEDRP